jgi:hypothetical protein
MSQMNTNWINDLTLEQQQKTYNEIVNYFTDQVLNEVLSKYDKPIDFNTQNV